MCICEKWVSYLDVPVKTSEMEGIILDWAVTRANYEINYEVIWEGDDRSNYSVDWAAAGPIIERERIQLRSSFDEEGWTASVWHNNTTIFEHGETALIAAMRCYVASALGEAVEIPEGLK